LGIASKFSVFAFLPLLFVPILLRKLSHILGVLLSFGLGYLRIWERTLGERGEFYEVSIYDLGRGFIVGEGFKKVMFGDKPAYPLGNIRAKGEFFGDTFYIYEYERKLALKPFVDFVDSLLIRSTGSERQYKFAKSIITGIREIDPETKRKFYETGVGHILAISGLHVGIIYLGIYWLIRFFNLGLYSHIIPSFLVWLYAFFVGFIPSVFRASLMLTFYAISKVISRPVKPLNVFMLSFRNIFTLGTLMDLFRLLLVILLCGFGLHPLSEKFINIHFWISNILHPYFPILLWKVRPPLCPPKPYSNTPNYPLPILPNFGNVFALSLCKFFGTSL